MDTLFAYAVICPLVMLAGFVDAIAGGGGLISLPAYLMAGVPVHQAIGTNKLSASMGTLLATYRYGRHGFIPWKLSLLSLPFAFIGSWCGADMALLLDDRLFLSLMLVILPLTGIYVLFWKPAAKEKSPFGYKRTACLAAITTFFIGMYDGFYGPGTGTFLLLLLTGAAHMTLTESNGMTKVINSATNLAGLAVFLLAEKVLFPLGIIAGLFGMAGSYIGSRSFAKSGGADVKPVILLVLAIFLIKVLHELHIPF